MIGFLVDGANDQSVINAINAVNKDSRCMVFSETLMPGINANVVQKYEAFHFNGTIITASFRLSQQLAHLGYCKKRYYYIKNYEWQNAQVLPYALMKNTLLHPNIDLIVQDASQVELVEELSNKKVKHVMNNWDVNVLRQIADE